jgi:hypothetical protein
MALRDDLAADFLLVDGLEVVTYRRLAEDGTTTTELSIPQALQRAATSPMFVGERFVGAGEVTIWHMPATSLTLLGSGPRKGDVVIAADQIRWVVWEVELQTFRTRWRLTCVRE